MQSPWEDPVHLHEMSATEGYLLFKISFIYLYTLCEHVSSSVLYLVGA